jgi:hypothetical protein
MGCSTCSATAAWASCTGPAIVTSMRMQRNHPGIETGLIFPSEAGTRPVGNDQLDDVWREEMRDASMALMRLVPTEPTVGRESRD